MTTSIVQAMLVHARTRPEHPALIVGDEKTTYGTLTDAVRHAASRLAAFDVAPGDRVVIAAPNTPSFVVAYLATHLAGGVAVPLDPDAPVARTRMIVERTSPRVVVSTKTDAAFEGARVVTLDELASESSAGAGDEPAASPRPADLADLLFTTGTTGRPKGVRLTHANIAGAAHMINSVIGNTAADIEVLPLPVYHSFGLGRVRCTLLAGGTIVLVSGYRMPAEIFNALINHRATGLVGVPAAFAVLLRFGAEGLGEYADQIRYIEIGSAAMPLEHKHQLMEYLPRTTLWMHYGLTEASRSAFIEFHRDRDRLDSIGTPSPGVEVSLRTEAGDEATTGEPGQLWIQSPARTVGYWDDDDLTRRTLVDGWLRTGDVAHRDADGYLYLHGRHDDMINVGGFKVAPEEVEAALKTHDAIADAACIGIPDPRGLSGQAVKVFLVAAKEHAAAPDDLPKPKELSKWLAPHLESYKVPSKYEWIDALPRTASGKLMRATLREREATQE